MPLEGPFALLRQSLLYRAASRFIYESLKVVRQTAKIIGTPTQAGQELENSLAGIFKTSKLFLKMFAAAFLVYSLSAGLNLSSGESQLRILATTLIETSLGLSIIYILSLSLPDRPSFYVLLQATLLFVGVYLIAQSLVSVPVRYLQSLIDLPSQTHELDVFATETERCLVNQSKFYWFMRGELEFFLYNDKWKPNDWFNWVLDNNRYAVVIPFLYVFAAMIGFSRKTSVLFFCVFVGIAFVVAVESYDALESKVRTLIADRNPQCYGPYVRDRVISKYSADLIATQAVYKINNASNRSDLFRNIPLTIDGTDVVMALQVRATATADWSNLAKTPAVFRLSYCSSYFYWDVLKTLNFGLVLLIYDKDGVLVHRQRISRSDCPTS